MPRLSWNCGAYSETFAQGYRDLTLALGSSIELLRIANRGLEARKRTTLAQTTIFIGGAWSN